MKHGSTFWNNLAMSLNSGWAIGGVGGPDGHLRVILSSIRHFVYTIDTGKRWILCGGTSTSEVLRCADHMQSAPAEIRNAAHSTAHDAIVDAANTDMTHADPSTRSVITTTLAAITQTQTYSTMMPAPENAVLHWIYILYRMRDGSITSRPICIPTSLTGAGARLLDPHHLMDAVVQVVAADTSPKSSSKVAAMLREGGGAVLENSLRREINQFHVKSMRGG